MTDWHERISSLPPGLRDGRWAQCALCIRGSRLHFQELAEQVLERRRRSVVRRALLAVGAVLVLLLACWIPADGSRIALGIVASLLGLAALDGAGRDFGREQKPYDLAVIDGRHGEVNLVGPDGTGMTLPISEVGMFLLVADPATGVFHLGVVLEGGFYLPWLHTRAGLAGISLAYLLGYATGRPARQLTAPLPFPPEALDSAEPIEAPTA